MSKRALVGASIAFSVVAYAGCSAPAEDPNGSLRVDQVAQADLASTMCAVPKAISDAWLLTPGCLCAGYAPGSKSAIECAYEQKVMTCLQTVGKFAPGDCTALPPLPVITLYNETTRGRQFLSEDLAVDVLKYVGDCNLAVATKNCIADVNNAVVFVPVPPYVIQPNLNTPVTARITHWCQGAPGWSTCDLEHNLVGIFDPCSTASCHQ